MRMKYAFQGACALMLAAASMPSLAGRDYTELYGQEAPASSARRTITITPEMRYVNVQGGSIVTFVSGDKSFTWYFNGPVGVRAFDLNEVAPAGMLDHKVRAYVSEDPRRLGG